MVLTDLRRDSRRSATPPVFVGGTGRSGTTVLAGLIGQHIRFALIPLEVRFHIDRHGLVDLMAGDTDLEQFRRKMSRKWYFHRNSARVRKGLHRIVRRRALIARVDAFAEAFPRDPWPAAGTLLRGLLDPLSQAAPASPPGWR